MTSEKISVAISSPLLRWIVPSVAVVLFFAIISILYFSPAVFEGRELFQQDVAGASGTAQDVRDHRETTGETSYWTNSLFGGMPMYQIAPSYPSTRALQTVQDVLTLRKPLNMMAGHAWLLFAMLMGSYLLMRALEIKRMPSVLGAVMWTFSSYFIILIVAGHIWKLTALCFIPPTIAGLIWTYRGKYLYGGLCTAFFTALQIMANHIQMSYYFFFMMLFLVIAFGVDAMRSHTLKRFGIATTVLLIAGTLGILVNLSSLYHTYEYTQETMRGGSELTLKQDDAQTATIEHENSGGLDKAYITQWSYGIGETWTLLVPNLKGGATGYLGQNDKVMQEVPQPYASTIAQMNQYWGDQPFTAGPVYVGAFTLFLFLLGCFIVKGPVKWALVAATLFSIALSWGHNMMWLTDFFIDHVPLYNKFRTVSSILVIAELTIPILAVLAFVEVMKDPQNVLKKRAAWGTSLFFTLGVAILFWITPNTFFSFISKQEAEMFAGAGSNFEVAGLMGALSSARIGLFRADVLRSIFFILLGLTPMILYAFGKLKKAVIAPLVILFTLADLWMVDKRYLNDAHFIDGSLVQAQAHPISDADHLITQDSDPHYRVLNLSVNTFNDATTSYMHRSIGGYHPAKLQRYQDLIEHQLTQNNQHVLDMLDTRYVIVPNAEQRTLRVVPNTYAFGPAWLTRNIQWVKDANEEIRALNSVNLRETAVVDKRWVNADLERLETKAVPDSTEFIHLTKYTPNRAEYDVDIHKPALAVFSEIYYPHGWQVTVDGKPAKLLRADYVLRALYLPAGRHTVKMHFAPVTIHRTEAVATSALIFLLLTAVYAVLHPFIFRKKNPKQ